MGDYTKRSDIITTGAFAVEVFLGEQNLWLIRMD